MMIVISDPVFGKNVRYLRRKYGLSRRSLAKLLGVEPKLIWQVEAPVWSYLGIEFPHKPFMRLETLFVVDINRMLHEDLTEKHLRLAESAIFSYYHAKHR